MRAQVASGHTSGAHEQHELQRATNVNLDRSTEFSIFLVGCWRCKARMRRAACQLGAAAARRGAMCPTRRPQVVGLGSRAFMSGPHVWGDIPGPAGGKGGKGASKGGVTRMVRGQETPTAAPVDFFEESKILFDRVEKGVESMVAVNDHFVVSRDVMEVSIDLGPAKGAFTLQRDLGKNEITFMSPHSGVHRYTFDENERRWLSVEAGRHDLVGILTRDLIRHAAGCPQI